jgi:8-oxo-dGTP diphosphatase
MMRYSLGLIFDQQYERVVLMRKNRPEWQRGRLNGVGGKLEAGETNLECVVREVSEETGLVTQPDDWAHIASIGGSDWQMEVFAMASSSIDGAKTMTDEDVGTYRISELPPGVMSNIPWLVALAIDRMRNREIQACDIKYVK